VIEKADTAYLLKLHLPFVSKDAVNMTHSGDELAISIGNFRRNIILPRVLATRVVQKAKFDGDYLVITFANEDTKTN
jgi:arsenite-transporting ATPase